MVYYSREETRKVMSYEIDKADMVRSVPTMFATFAGGGNPMYKTKDDWWAPPEFMNIGFSEAVMEAMQKILFEQIPEICVKYSAQIEARYKKKK
jgi:hypothetical protein